MDYDEPEILSYAITHSVQQVLTVYMITYDRGARNACADEPCPVGLSSITSRVTLGQSQS